MGNIDITKDYKTCETIAMLIKEKLEFGEDIKLYLIPFLNESRHKKYKVSSNNDDINQEIFKEFEYGYLLHIIAALFKKIYTELDFLDYCEEKESIDIIMTSPNSRENKLIISIQEPLILYGARYLATEIIIKPGILNNVDNFERVKIDKALSLLSDIEIKELLKNYIKTSFEKDDYALKRTK